MGDFEKDLEDLHVVIKHLRTEYNYHIEAIIGHSRGSLVGWYYLSDVERRKRGSVSNSEGYILDAIPCWAALSGRWRMQRIHDRDSAYEPAFAEKGYYSWEVKVLGQKVTAQVRRQDVDKFASYPIAEKVAEFPLSMDCLLMQGTSDKAVPPADIGFYVNKLNEKQRRPTSAQIHLVDDADHNF
jgi:pimeloyl-ACP methyl ester carboxylesterase